MSEKSQTDYAALLKRSLVAIDELEAKLAAAKRERAEPIAIVGMACRFPGGANTPAEYWGLLKNGVDAVTEVPSERWDAEAFFDPDPDAVGKSYTRWGAFLDDVDLFDADLFGVSPREAVSVDPQQRVLLEVSWEALERAGIAPSDLRGSRTAVYVGISTHDYSFAVADAIGANNGGPYTASGTAHSMASGRIAYAFGLHGPNAAVDTACSSAHVAVHLATRSLRNGEADMALAGGVNLTLTANGSILTSRARMMSPEGRCKTFDVSADGYVRGEGCGVVVLKRLSDAERDGDQVLAVIRGSALNQDGRSSGLTAPNGQAQEAVLRAALDDANLEPDDISYIEAHGTGTSLGDPIEVKALGAVFGARDSNRPLVVGSVKTNIGHTEAAAGIAGLIKAVLALEHRQIPPHLHLHEPNPLIPWDTLPIRVPTELQAWQTAPGQPRRAGISSFGFSGTNGHILLEEAPPRVDDQPQQEQAGQPRLLVLSGESLAALKAQARQYADYLEGEHTASLRDVASALARDRSHLTERLAVVAADSAQAAARLGAFVAGDVTAVARGRWGSRVAPELVFLFTGQGAQYVGMGQQLYASEPVFRAAMDECARALEPHLDKPLLDVIRGEGDCAGLLDDTAYTQPALFAIEYSMARLWRAWGIEPTAVMGHSVGEYVAACLAGVFSLEDGLKLIAARGRLMSALPRDGAMAAVFADEERVRDALAGNEDAVAIAAVNGPTSTVISGAADAVNRVAAALEADGIEHQPLTVSHAFHSPLMDPILDEFEAIVGSVKLSAPEISLFSNLTGGLADESITQPAYWRRHLREAVRFKDAVDALIEDGFRVFLEVGPAPVLSGMARRCERADSAAWIGSLVSGRDDRVSMLEALGQLHVHGMQVDWVGLLGPARAPRPVDLPVYPFQRQRYWQDGSADAGRNRLAPLRHAHPLLDGALDSPLHIFEADLGLDGHPWLADHRILEYTLFPATGFIELLLAGVRELTGSIDGDVRDLAIREPLVLPETGSVRVQVIVAPRGEGRYHVQVCSRYTDSGEGGVAHTWRQHVEASFVRTKDRPDLPAAPPAFEQAEDFDAEEYYAKLEERDAHYGPAFRAIRHIAIDKFEVLGELQLPQSVARDAARNLLHPALLDAAFQLPGILLLGPRAEDATQYLPLGIDRVTLHRAGADAARCHVRVEPFEDGADSLRAHIVLYDTDERVIVEVHGLQYRRASRELVERAIASSRPTALADDWLFEVKWQPEPVDPDTDTSLGGHWLVLGDADGIGERLAQRLNSEGARVTVSAAQPTDAAAIKQAIRAAAADDDRGLAGIVSLWALQAQPGPADIENLEQAHRELVSGTLNLMHALGNEAPRLWLVTRGAQPTPDFVPDLRQAPLLGLGNVIAAERPDLHCVRVDLDAVCRDDDADRLFEMLRHADEEDRIALRDGTRFVARMVPGLSAPPPAEPRVLEITQRGQLDRLELRPLERRAPGPGEVELRVHATGLNFRDVLNALGMYPGDPGPLGNECAGVVTAVGEGVEDLEVGDEAVAMVDRSFASYVLAPAKMVVRKPPELSFAAAATLPVTFLTADYALRILGRMRKGERVLIHAATGGVGMAAVQIARAAGVEIIGTASPGKQALARELGVHHVANSRSLEFEQEVMEATNGEGVDIVLNSLAGEFIPASLRLLRGGGRFIEIGKTDIWNEEEVGRQFPGVDYFALYLGEVTAADPDLVRGMLEEIVEKCVDGRLEPLPMRVYPIERAESAFRFMAQGYHTGKLVLVQSQPFGLRSDGSYLVTGGLGGLGLAVADWLAQNGAGNIVLLSRRPPSGEAETRIAEIEATGARVLVLAADVADEAALAAALAEVSSTLPPLRGVLHAAGSVDDGLLGEQSWQRFADVMRAKVRGSWNLHRLTLTSPLDFFVMFSSGAALLGSPGQSNYAAANAFLDSLAYLRRSEGLPAHSINWGIWSEVGMATRVDEQHQRRWAGLGLMSIQPAAGVRMLQSVLEGAREPQVAAMPIDRSKLPAQVPAFFAEMVVATESTDESAAYAARDVLPELLSLDGRARTEALIEYLSGQISEVLALDVAQAIDPQRSLLDFGIDSLMTMELRNRLQSALTISIAADELLSSPTLGELAELVGSRLVEPETAGGGDAPGGVSQGAEAAADDEDEQWVQI